jgi:hypothetical protein
MERFTQFGLRGDADEQFRCAVRDGFKSAGLSHAQLTQAMEWYRDHGQRLGGDAAKVTESFAEFAAANRWPVEHLDAAVSVYGRVRDQGPTAVMAPAPAAAEDAATIARAAELLRTDPTAYWRDVELQEAQYEALERQESASASAAGVSAPAVPVAAPAPLATAPKERQRHDEIMSMMRDPGRSREYWGNEAVQQEFRGLLGRLGSGESLPGASGQGPIGEPVRDAAASI